MIMRQTRHTSFEVRRSYRQTGELFIENASGLVGLRWENQPPPQVSQTKANSLGAPLSQDREPQ
jgi:hypothetical protein